MREIKFRAWDKENKTMVNSGGSIKALANIEGYIEHDFVLTQYTGLKDKNGKEIYEGDVLQIPLQWWHDKWHMNSKAKRRITVEEFGIVPFHNGDWSVGHEECEIIGNIYENPELVE